MELKVSRGTSSNPPNGRCDSGRIDDSTRDPTEPTLTEEAARRRTQLYSRLVNSLDCIVWEADARTLEFSFVSPQAERMLGYPAEQWLSLGSGPSTSIPKMSSGAPNSASRLHSKGRITNSNIA